MHHLLTYAYRAYLWLKKRFFYLYAPFRLRAVNFFTNKHTIHVAVLTLAFFVTATNIYASETNLLPPSHDRVSIMNDIIGGADELVVEDAEFFTEQSGVQNQAILGALGPNDLAMDGGNDSVDDGVYDDEAATDAYESPLANAINPDDGSPVMPEKPPAPPTRDSMSEYVVEQGDNIGSIARRFGLNVETVLIANNLNVRSLIRIGQKLKILPVNGVLYTVKKGDTISKIAKTYKSDTDKISTINGIESERALVVGTEIILPDGKLPPPPTPKKAPSVTPKNIANIFTPPADTSGSTGMIWPVASRRITQYWRGSRHTGLDVGAPTGTAIYAADDGIVTTSGWNRGGYGNMIVVDHGNGVFTRYGHASKLLVSAGDVVHKGDVIAHVGSTGRSTGPHLHFEVMTGNSSHRVNPLTYVK